MADLAKIAEELSSLTVIEAADLSKLLEEKWGVSASIPVAGVAASVEDNEKKIVEKTEFDIILSTIGDKKINVIKAVRSVTSLGLKEAKALVDGAPLPIKEGVSKEEVDKVRSILEAAGATVEVK